MKKSSFGNNGFVLHGINHVSKHRISAWYTREGELIDCEMLAGRQSRKIPYNWRVVRQELNDLGKIWRY